jgi:L1 cell adhesion molecule like protein
MQYMKAVENFTKALVLDPTNHILFSNRSGAYLAMGNAEDAAADAKECVRIAPTWAKGFGRLGAALVAQSQFTEAVKAYAQGLAQDAGNAQMMAAMVQAQQSAANKSGAQKKAADEDGLGEAESAQAKAKHDASSELIIGIDLGTTYSCVGVWEHDHVEIIANSEGSRTTPSVVSFSDEDRLIGQAAQSQAAGNPTNTIFDAKRLIGRNIKEPLVVEDIKRFPFKVVPGPDGETPSIEVQYQGKTKRFAPEEISAMVLLKMKSERGDRARNFARKRRARVPHAHALVSARVQRLTPASPLAAAALLPAPRAQARPRRTCPSPSRRRL